MPFSRGMRPVRRLTACAQSVTPIAAPKRVRPTSQRAMAGNPHAGMAATLRTTATNARSARSSSSLFSRPFGKRRSFARRCSDRRGVLQEVSSAMPAVVARTGKRQLSVELSGADCAFLETYRVERGLRSWGAVVRSLITEAIARGLTDGDV